MVQRREDPSNNRVDRSMKSINYNHQLKIINGCDQLPQSKPTRALSYLAVFDPMLKRTKCAVTFHRNPIGWNQILNVLKYTKPFFGIHGLKPLFLDKAKRYPIR